MAELTGFLFTQWASRAYQVTPGGINSVIYFTNLNEIAVASDGSLKALQLGSDVLSGPDVGGS